MLGRTNTGGGGVGGVLTVTAPAGVTVSVSKDGKTKTKTANADGLAVFNGLETGTWTLTITDGVQTASKTVTITADYSTSITLFSATINITYPSGSTCTCSDGSTTLTAPDTSGTWACVVPNTGTWTVSCTKGTESTSETVTITADGQSVAVELSYWNGELFVNGDTFEKVTGGWSGNGWTSSYSAAPIIGGTLSGNTYVCTNNGVEDSPFGMFSGNKIDFSKYSTLSVNISAKASNTLLIINSEKKATTNLEEYTPTAYKKITANGTHTLSVADLNEGYIAVYGWTTGGTSTLKITDIHLE